MRDEETTDSQSLATLLKLHLNSEEVAQTIGIGKLGYQAKGIQVTEANSILFEFPSLRTDSAVETAAPQIPAYKFLFLLGLHAKTSLGNIEVNALLDLKKKHNLDDIIVWTAAQYDLDHIRILKENGIDVLHYGVPSSHMLKERSLSRFYPLPAKQLEECLVLNHLASALVVRLKKHFHRVLSDVAAASYDRKYASERPATREFMEFEDRLLKKLLDRMQNERPLGRAVDVGCGTGRHSITLAGRFSEVVAFDFSKNMIQVAQEAKRQKGDTRILYRVSDFEYETLPDENDLIGTCDLVVASFGMGSFVEDTSKMLRRFRAWLRPGGYIFICFYNKESLLQRLKLPWSEHGLATTLNVQTRSLNVELSPGVVFTIYCKPFDSITSGQIRTLFRGVEEFSFPSTLALFPPRAVQRDALELLRSIDTLLDDHEENRRKQFQLGHYIVVIGSKPETSENAHQTVLRALQNVPDDEYELVEHRPVFSVEDVLSYFPTVSTRAMVKSIVLRLKEAGQATYNYVLVCSPANKVVNVRMIARLLGVGRDRLEMATEEHILELGVTLGAIGPLAFERGRISKWLIDEDLWSSAEEWLYMGSGDNQSTLKIRATTLKNISPHFIRYSTTETQD